MKRFLTWLLLFFYCLVQGFSQDIESLEIRLQNDSFGNTERIDLLNLISREYIFINSKKAYEYASQALELSKKTGYQIGIAYAYRNYSAIYRSNEMPAQAMDFLHDAIKLFFAEGDSIGVANCYISLAYIYKELNNNSDELKYSILAYNEFRRMGIPERIGVTAHNLGESLLNNSKLDSAKTIIEYAIRLNDSIQNLPVLSSCYMVMGMVEFRYGNHDLAEQNFNNALEISAELGKHAQKIATIESFLHLAKIYQITGNKQDYETNMVKAAEFATTYNLMKYLPKIYLELMNFYLQNKDIPKIQHYFGHYQTTIDSINAMNVRDRSELVKNIILVKNLMEEKESLEELKALQLKSIRLRNQVIVLSALSLILLLVLVLKLLRANRQIHQSHTLLKEKNNTIEAQKAELSDLNQTKDKFFSIVAHDLRSPLFSLKTFSELLNDQIDELSKEEILMMGKQLHLSVDNTIKMVDNLIQWANLQMKRYEFNPSTIPLSELLRELCNLYKTIGREKEIRLVCTVPDDVVVFGDKNQLELIFRNLINNALKFTNPGGEVQLHAKFIGNEQVKITVSDTGIGIRTDDISELFAPSRKKSEPGTKGEKGTGMGLMLVKEFISINNGSISVESECGKGSIFTVILKGNVN
jgi:signal transduction histidine kinase